MVGLLNAQQLENIWDGANEHPWVRLPTGKVRLGDIEYEAMIQSPHVKVSDTIKVVMDSLVAEAAKPKEKKNLGDFAKRLVDAMGYRQSTHFWDRFTLRNAATKLYTGEKVGIKQWWFNLCTELKSSFKFKGIDSKKYNEHCDEGLLKFQCHQQTGDLKGYSFEEQRNIFEEDFHISEIQNPLGQQKIQKLIDFLCLLNEKVKKHVSFQEFVEEYEFECDSPPDN